MNPRITVGGVPLREGVVRNVSPVEPRNVPFEWHSNYNRLFKTEPVIWEVAGMLTTAEANRVLDAEEADGEVWVAIKWQHALVVFQATDLRTTTAPKRKGFTVSVTFVWKATGSSTPGYFYSDFRKQA